MARKQWQFPTKPALHSLYLHNLVFLRSGTSVFVNPWSFVPKIFAKKMLFFGIIFPKQKKRGLAFSIHRPSGRKAVSSLKLSLRTPCSSAVVCAKASSPGHQVGQHRGSDSKQRREREKAEGLSYRSNSQRKLSELLCHQDPFPSPNWIAETNCHSGFPVQLSSCRIPNSTFFANTNNVNTSVLKGGIMVPLSAIPPIQVTKERKSHLSCNENTTFLEENPSISPLSLPKTDPFCKVLRPNFCHLPREPEHRHRRNGKHPEAGGAKLPPVGMILFVAVMLNSWGNLILRSSQNSFLGEHPPIRRDSM